MRIATCKHCGGALERGADGVWISRGGGPGSAYCGYGNPENPASRPQGDEWFEMHEVRFNMVDLNDPKEVAAWLER